VEQLLLGMTLGICSALLWPELPVDVWGWGSLIVGFVLLTRTRLMGAICLGLGWAILFFNHQLLWLKEQHVVIPNQHELNVTVLQAYQKNDSQQLLVSAQKINQQRYWPAPMLRLTLSNNKNPLKRGDQLHVLAKLKIPHGLGNPAGFNAERWLLGQGITATGTINRAEYIYQADHSWRDRWLGQSRQLMQGFRQPELLMALIYGEQQDVDKADWQTLRDTGLIHLIAISGMHIGLIAWIGMALSRLLFQRVAERFPALHWLVGMGFALLYSALADFSAPTVRSLIMLAIWVVLRVWQREWSGSRIWLFSLAIMLIFDPWSLFSAGCWLSFFAVGILGIAGFLWRKPSMWQLQWLMTLLLLPFQLVLFDGLSLSSVLVNIPAGPWFTFSIVPIALVAGVLVPIFPSLAHLGFWLCDLQLDWLMLILEWIQHWGSGWMAISLQQQQILLWALAGGACWYFSPVVMRREWGLVALTVTGLLFSGCQSEPEWKVDMLDVGQGLSVLVSQGDRALLFDTGDRYPGGYNMADAAIFPMLEYRGIKQLDYLVISHRDKDHAANWEKVSQKYPQAHIVSSSLLTPETQICQRWQQWNWGQLQITVLSPSQSSGGDVNEDSCVLRISDGNHSVLLTGDVQREAETALVQLPASLLRSQILSSPHHGSKSSSSLDFIAAVSPDYVVHSAGYQNRWHHPHAEIVARYQKSQQWVNANDGLVSFEISQNSLDIKPFRRSQPWYRQMDAWLADDHQLK
jgi:competence protein ComEC